MSALAIALIVIPHGFKDGNGRHGPIGRSSEHSVLSAKDTFESDIPGSLAKSDLIGSSLGGSALRAITGDDRTKATDDGRGHDYTVIPIVASTAAGEGKLRFAVKWPELPERSDVVAPTLARAVPDSPIKVTARIDDGIVAEQGGIVELASFDQLDLKPVGFMSEAAASFDERAEATINSVSAQRLSKQKTDAMSRRFDPSLGEKLLRNVAADQTLAAMLEPNEAEIDLVTVAENTATPIAIDPHFRVQIAAVRKEIDARHMWDRSQSEFGAMLGGLTPFFERAETTNGIFHRIQVGPFQTRSEARDFCARLTERDKTCFVIAR